MSEQREKIGKLLKIADSGDEEAQFVYGLLRLKGGNGVVKNEIEAVGYLSKSADSKGRRDHRDGEGYPFASYYFGLFHHGEYEALRERFFVGPEHAWPYFDKAAWNGGIVDAMVKLAQIGEEAKVSYEKSPYPRPLMYHKVENLLIPCAWAYLAKARDHAEADKLVRHFEQEEPSTANNPDLLQEAQNEADEWNQRIVWEAKPPSIDEIIEKHEKRSGKQD